MLKRTIKKVPGLINVARKLGLMAKESNGRRALLEMLPKNSVGAEIGVHVGDFSRRILEIVTPRELHLIDPWRHEASPEYKDAWHGGQAKGGQRELDDRYTRVRDKFDRELRSGLVKIHRDDSTVALGRMPDEYFDWIYIDGNHSYDFIKNDLELSYRKTKVGGYITGDDYIDGGWWNGAVKKAVDEFATSEPARLVVEIRNDQFILRKAPPDK